MTKADLVERVFERIGFSRKEAAEAVEQILDIIKENLCRGEKIKISGFGTFAVNQKHARRGRNPQTGEAITIDSRRVLSFKSSHLLKDHVDSGAKRSQEPRNATFKPKR